MTLIAQHTNDTDVARTGVISFLSEHGSALTIEPCWLPAQDNGFVRMKVQRGNSGLLWEWVFDYEEFTEMVGKAITARKEVCQ